MKHKFTSNARKSISPGSPSEVRSAISVSGVQGRIREVSLTLDVKKYVTYCAVASVRNVLLDIRSHQSCSVWSPSVCVAARYLFSYDFAITIPVRSRFIL